MGKVGSDTQDLLAGRYELLEVVGRGGQGEVWLAIDRHHDLKVAIKVRPDTPETHEALRAEAELLRELTPLVGIVGATALVREGFSEGGQHYLVMEWVDGRPLSRVLRDEGSPGLPLESVLDLLVQIADALDHLHRHDPPIIHGDVKPANIVLCDGGRAVLVDFGASRRPGPPELGVYATSSYLAPEVGVGGSDSPATDVFALAATAFVLLTGSPPTPGVAPDLSSIPEEARARVLAAIDRGLSVDPHRRQRTAGEFIDELLAKPAVARTPPPTHIAKNGKVEIAYQAFGQGAVDVFNCVQDVIDIRWEEPRLAAFLETIASFARVIFPEHPPRGRFREHPDEGWDLQSHTEDILAVMEHARSPRCVLVANGPGVPVAINLAARYPDRTAGLVLVGGHARFWEAPDYPLGLPVERVRAIIEQQAKFIGSDSPDGHLVTNHAHDDVFRRWLGRWMRRTGGIQPREDGLIGFMDWDVRELLGRVRAPTIVITEADGVWFDYDEDRNNALYLAEHIPNARFVESTDPDWYFLGDHGRIILEAIRQLVREVETERR